MAISKAPYFDGCKTNPRDFVNWMNGMEQFFEQANFADNIKVRYAELKLRGGIQMFWENLEYFRYIKYEPAISVWEDMKEKDRKSTRLNSSHNQRSRMPSSA